MSRTSAITDHKINEVIEKIGSEGALTPGVLVRYLDLLLRRMTFRYEPTWKCKNMPARLYAALQTEKALAMHEGLLKERAPEHSETFSELLLQVWRYCDYLLEYFFEQHHGLDPLRKLTGDENAFYAALPPLKSFRDEKAREEAGREADEPRMLCIRQMDALLAAFPETFYDTFVCHNSADKSRARELAKALESRGFSVCIDETEFPPGYSLTDALQHIYRTVRSAIVLLTANGEGPTQAAEIIELASQNQRRGIPVVPLLADGMDPDDLPEALRRRNLHWLKLDAGLTDQVLNGLERAIRSTRAPE